MMRTGLHVFKTVVEHGNISKAANSLAISRPVISRTIAGLEHRLGVPLFDRSPQGVEPTLYGRALHKLAITVFDDLRRGVQEIEFLADPTAGDVRIGWRARRIPGFVGVADPSRANAISSLRSSSLRKLASCQHRNPPDQKIQGISTETSMSRGIDIFNYFEFVEVTTGPTRV